MYLCNVIIKLKITAKLLYTISIIVFGPYKGTEVTEIIKTDSKYLCSLDKKVIESSNVVRCKYKIGTYPKVNRDTLENICRYCEHQSIYDKLSSYGDFYYKVKKLLR